ncbi:hypothetical protein FPSE_11239 [Fusarium pseudograminearum CS3096]|uniref:Uncharacterized protein n=1 Tax=Fusarium pseudograminearum (strain CS3096) TaxID=1028729 RepID=K3UB33_FUSPC|nr:hypothetical protein FPSE_11239 [Fusarium pseudograminearum CS3096]EKJ68581.1 hypothetical protein FPSE_11239 [Fusarium pseudograminearum CS3096]KAF0636528.1 hypothetical protein FPSE5266_11239 [Fusarium pseudograminearum]
MDQHATTIRRMLGGLTIPQFALLSPRDRRTLFRQNLVQRQPVLIDEADDDGSLNPKIADGVLLRQRYFMGEDETGKQLVKEASDVYYGENHFNVRLHWLREFMTDTLGDYKTKVPVAPLIKGSITVLVDSYDALDDFYLHEEGCDSDSGIDDPKSVHYRHGTGEAARWTQKRLQDIFLFTNAQHITLVLYGRGVLDGSDLATHQMIKDISYVVKLLIEEFGDRFAIKKMISRGDDYEGNHPSRSIRSYWDSPTEMAREEVRQGEATFEQVMQIEVEEWTRVFPRTIGLWMGREILV